MDRKSLTFHQYSCCEKVRASNHQGDEQPDQGMMSLGGWQIMDKLA